MSSRLLLSAIGVAIATVTLFPQQAAAHWGRGWGGWGGYRGGWGGYRGYGGWGGYRGYGGYGYGYPAYGYGYRTWGVEDDSSAHLISDEVNVHTPTIASANNAAVNTIAANNNNHKLSNEELHKEYERDIFKYISAVLKNEKGLLFDTAKDAFYDPKTGTVYTHKQVIEIMDDLHDDKDELHQEKEKIAA